MRTGITRSSFSARIVLAAAILMLMLPAAGSAATVVWNFTVPAREVKPNAGSFVFPTSLFADGKARYFVYKRSPSEWIRFFVIRSRDGVIRAAFDACDVCFKSRKGYMQNGNFMICRNCGLKFRSDKINEIKGGCNPAPLRRTVGNGNLVITERDLIAGERFFR